VLVRLVRFGGRRFGAGPFDRPGRVPAPGILHMA
jgi:hypothetical protein